MSHQDYAKEFFDFLEAIEAEGAARDREPGAGYYVAAANMQLCRVVDSCLNDEEAVIPMALDAALFDRDGNSLIEALGKEVKELTRAVYSLGPV
jgi:hypothetical protein